MQGYQAATYGERIAEIYDDLYQDRFDVGATVDFLVPFAGGTAAGERSGTASATGGAAGSALELAVGTGRIAVPLAARGVNVDGIDISPAMISKMWTKDGGDRVGATVGDFADVAVPGRYPLVYLVFNTLFALLTQDDQLRCFRNVAEHLTDDGVFVVEAFVPDLSRFDRGQRVSLTDLTLDLAKIDVSHHDPVEQRVHSQHLVFEDGGTVRLYPVSLRYSWPAELDLMARLAGLELRERFGGWRHEPFTADSTAHVSVYGRP